MIRIARYGSLATAAAVLLALGVSLLHHNTVLAFGEVVENVKKAKSVTFVTKMPTIWQGSRRGVLQQKFYLQGQAYRMEIPSAQEDAGIPPDAPPVLLAVIADAKQKKALQLDFVRKTAQILGVDDKRWQEMAQASASATIEKLRQLKNDDAEPIGQEELDGRKMQVYRLKKSAVFLGLHAGEGDTAKLWADPKSGLPVRIQVESPFPDSKEKNFAIFEQFTWNEALDPNLFKLEVPKDFTIEKK